MHMVITSMRGENSEKPHQVCCFTKPSLQAYSTIFSLVFIEAERLKKAMIAHERCLEWQELFDIAVREDFSETDLVDMGYRVAGMLSLMAGYDYVSDFSFRGFDIQEAI